jgi:hypothetical protein
MPKLLGIKHLNAAKALEKAGFRRRGRPRSRMAFLSEERVVSQFDVEAALRRHVAR